MPLEEQAVASGRERWSSPGVPHGGWTCIEIDDLEDARWTCAMCESTEIRYSDHMRHPGFPDVLVVGCVCAGHRESNRAVARERDRRMATRSLRRRRWLTRRWNRSAKGNEWLRADGFRITIYQKRDSWAATVASDENEKFVAQERHERRRRAPDDATIGPWMSKPRRPSSGSPSESTRSKLRCTAT
jgi:hypothetical protein